MPCERTEDSQHPVQTGTDSKGQPTARAEALCNRFAICAWIDTSQRRTGSYRVDQQRIVGKRAACQCAAVVPLKTVFGDSSDRLARSARPAVPFPSWFVGHARRWPFQRARGSAMMFHARATRAERRTGSLKDSCSLLCAATAQQLRLSALGQTADGRGHRPRKAAPRLRLRVDCADNAAVNSVVVLCQTRIRPPAPEPHRGREDEASHRPTARTGRSPFEGTAFAWIVTLQPAALAAGCVIRPRPASPAGIPAAGLPARKTGQPVIGRVVQPSVRRARPDRHRPHGRASGKRGKKLQAIRFVDRNVHAAYAFVSSGLR